MAQPFLALLDEAKQQHLSVTGHVPFTLTVAEVSDAGQNIEHLENYLPGCVRNQEATEGGCISTPNFGP
jgi:hypothetical protein